MNDPGHQLRLPAIAVVIVGSLALALIVAMRISHEPGYWSQNAPEIIGSALLCVGVMGGGLGYMGSAFRERKAAEVERLRGLQQRYAAAPEEQVTLDTVACVVALRGQAGRTLLPLVAGWSQIARLSPDAGAATIAAVARALLDRRSSWSHGGCMDDEPVPRERAAERVATPLQRLGGALPEPSAGPDLGYRGDTGESVVVIALGGASPNAIPNIGQRPDSRELAGLLESMARNRSWSHVQVVGGGPLAPDQLAALPFPLAALPG